MEAGSIRAPGIGANLRDDAAAGTESVVERDVTAATIADPAALGLAGFALTTMILSVYNTGALDAAGEPVVLGVAAAYGGLAQLLAGMWEFRKGNTFGAAAFSSYGAFWLSFFVLLELDATKLGGAAGDAVGLYLLGWGFFTFYMWIASFRTSAAVNVVFLLLWITYGFLSGGEFAANATLTHIGGGLGLATAAAAWYAAFGVVTNNTFKKPIIPLGPLNR